MANNIMVAPRSVQPQTTPAPTTGGLDGVLSTLTKDIEQFAANFLKDDFSKIANDLLGALGLDASKPLPPPADPSGTRGTSVHDTTDVTNKAAPPGEVTPVDPGGPPVLKKIGHVWVIMMENQDWSSVKGNSTAPYINNVLLKQGAHAENYVAETHPSEPNYVELEAGSTLGISDDADPATNHQSTHDHLTRYMTNAGVSWKSYCEDITGTEVPLTSVGKYAPKHNPDVYFDDNTGGNNPNDPFGIAHNRPLTEMATDLQNGTEPKYNFIVPNLINDGHNGPTSQRVAQQDAFLQKIIPQIQASPDYQKDGAIMIVWDEGKQGAHNPSGMITLSPFAKPGYSNNISYSHASTLRTIQEIFGVGPFLGDAANATDLSDLFQDPGSNPNPPGGNPPPTGA